jgi:hypothetical protein
MAEANTNVNNVIDYAGEVIKRLNKDYAQYLVSVASVLAKMKALPKQIDNESQLSEYGTVMAEAREVRKRGEAYHESEKAPYLGGGRGVDSFFFAQIGKLGRRKEGETAGGIDICQARVDAYMQRLLEIEQAKRAAEAREAARKLEEEQRRVAEERRKAEEAAAAAARARKPENIEAHREAALEHAEEAAKAEFRADRAAEIAEDARIDTLAKPADMVRTRLAGGQLATMAQQPVVQILDASKLDKEMLWPFIKEEHLLMALKAWAKTKDYKTQMAGALIDKRNKGQIKG